MQYRYIMMMPTGVPNLMNFDLMQNLQMYELKDPQNRRISFFIEVTLLFTWRGRGWLG